MKVFKFNLSGKTAFFKNPEVNEIIYFSFGNIHKVALLGLFGAILGLKGYIQLNNEMKNPEFYEKLKKLKVAICPKGIGGSFEKKIQVFNNSVGYATKEESGNLIVRQQWLENPSWDIYILLDCKEAEMISEFIENRKSVYIPYLGSNDHIASISEMSYESLELNKNKEDNLKIDSLFLKEDFQIDRKKKKKIEEEIYKYTESLPVALNGNNKYVYKTFSFTNMYLKEENKNIDIYTCDNKNLVFI